MLAMRLETTSDNCCAPYGYPCFKVFKLVFAFCVTWFSLCCYLFLGFDFVWCALLFDDVVLFCFVVVLMLWGGLG